MRTWWAIAGTLVSGMIGLAGATAAGAYEPPMNYTLQCMGCHTPDGSGVADRVPSIKDTLVPFSRTPQGRAFLVQVPGSSQSTLNNAELADLLNWMIRTLSTTKPTDTFVPFTEREVATYRAQTLIEVRATRERLLSANVEKTQ